MLSLSLASYRGLDRALGESSILPLRFSSVSKVVYLLAETFPFLDGPKVKPPPSLSEFYRV